MMNILEGLFKKNVLWERDKESDDNFKHVENGVLFSLTINDFPDEVMFTLASNGESIDFDDLPNTWKIEGM